MVTAKRNSQSISVTDLVKFFKCPASLVSASAEFSAHRDAQQTGIHTHHEVDRQIKRARTAQFRSDGSERDDDEFIFSLDQLKR